MPVKRTDNTQIGPTLKLGYLHAGEVLYQPGDSLGPRVLIDYEVVYILEGEITYKLEDERHKLKPGAFVIGQPGTIEEYLWDVEQCTRHAFFHFSIEQMPQDWPSPETWPRTRFVENPLCACLMEHILQHAYESSKWPLGKPTPSECRLVETIIDTLIEEPHTTIASFERERPEPVRRALLHLREIVENNPSYALSLQEIAERANVTEKHLCKLFAKWIGYPPIKTFILYKLEASRPLLMHTNLTIKEISLRSGFENQLYYSRLFSNTYGCSPSSFRNQLKNGIEPPPNILPIDLTARSR